MVNKEKAWVYNASLTHRFTDDITAYLSYGHSWRPRTNNLNLQSTDRSHHGIRDEPVGNVEQYEAGVKMRLLDRKMTVNLAAFYQDYSGYIFSALGVPYINNTAATPSVATAASLSVNADGKVKGFDIELAYRPTGNSRFRPMSIMPAGGCRMRWCHATIPMPMASPMQWRRHGRKLWNRSSALLPVQRGTGLSVGLECVVSGGIQLAGLQQYRRPISAH